MTRARSAVAAALIIAGLSGRALADDGCWAASDGTQCCRDMEPLPDACANGPSDGSGQGDAPMLGPEGVGTEVTSGGFQPLTMRVGRAGAIGGAGATNGRATTPGRRGGSPAPRASALATGGDGSSAGGPSLMERFPYVGDAKHPCPGGPPTGRCTYEGGKPLPPPPSADGFAVVPVGILPFYPGTNHVVLGLHGNRKWALHFIGRKQPGHFLIHLDTPNGFMPRGPRVMFASVSQKPGDFDVPFQCLVAPNQLTTGPSGGPPHSTADIQVSLDGRDASGRDCLLKNDGRDYYLNIAGDCSAYWWAGDEKDLAADIGAGCVTDLVEVNGWEHALTPGGPAEYCTGKGFGPSLMADGFNCVER